MKTERLSAPDWTVICLSMLGVSVSVIPVAILTLSVFLRPLSEVHHWGRSEVALALTFLSIAMALAMLPAGRIIDRYGPRWPALISLLLLAATLAAYPLCIEKFGLSGFYTISTIAGIVGAPSSSVAFVRLLSGRFDRRRGMALGVAMSGVALGGAMAPWVAASAMTEYGWQSGFYALALLPSVIGLPVIWSVTRIEPAGSRKSATFASEQTLSGLTFAEALRTRSFVMLLVIFLVSATTIHGVQIHLAALMQDLGYSQSLSVAAVSFMFIVSIVTRLAAGVLFDHYFAPRVGAVCFAFAAIGMVLLIASPGSLGVLLAVALLGVGAGAESDLLALLISRYFGMRAFGQIYGAIFASFMIGSAIGPYLLGLAFDANGDYKSAMIGCAIALFASVALLSRLPAFAYATPEDRDASAVR